MDMEEAVRRARSVHEIDLLMLEITRSQPCDESVIQAIRRRLRALRKNDEYIETYLYDPHRGWGLKR